MPRLENVLLVDGLKVNLIGIIQLCDDNLFVQFIKDSCLVTYNSNLCVMKGKWSSDNCYLPTNSLRDLLHHLDKQFRCLALKASSHKSKKPN